MVIVISSTEIEVSWEEVPAISQNGFIIMYEVQYEPLDTFDDQISIETVWSSLNDESEWSGRVCCIRESVDSLCRDGADMPRPYGTPFVTKKDANNPA